MRVSDKMVEGMLGHFHRGELTGGGIGSGGFWCPAAPESDVLFCGELDGC